MTGSLASSTLQWWLESGVDVIIGEEPRNWLEPAPTPPSKPALALAEPSQSLPENLPAFQAWLVDSPDLPGQSSSAPRLGPAGDPHAQIMILTDMPSLADLSAGLLVSSHGLFDKMLSAIQLSRDTVYLASLSPFRPTSMRLTAEAEKRCTEVARHHIGLVAPKAVLLLGDLCARLLIGSPVNQARSKWHEIETPRGRVSTLVTLKPEQLNQQPNLKGLAWEDLQLLKKGTGE